MVINIHPIYLFDKPFSRLQLFPKKHLEGEEDHHGGVHGGDAVGVADTGQDDAGQTYADNRDQEKQPRGLVKYPEYNTVYFCCYFSFLNLSKFVAADNF